jgi:hypothetical protein
MAGKPTQAEWRRDLGRRFGHHVTQIGVGQGLLESKHFKGRSAEEEAAWERGSGARVANRQRLESEILRDAMLAVTGSLTPALGGPMVRVPLEPEVYELIFTEGEPDGLWPVTPDATEHTRRSIYLFNKRNVRLPMLEALDQPDTLNSCAFRPVSTFAPQALILMNGHFVQEQGKALAVKLAKECGPDATKQIEALYRRTVGRAPRPEELKLANEFLDTQTESIRDRIRARLSVGIDPKVLPVGADLAPVRALADLCVVLFNTHEFVYLP